MLIRENLRSALSDKFEALRKLYEKRKLEGGELAELADKMTKIYECSHRYDALIIQRHALEEALDLLDEEQTLIESQIVGFLADNETIQEG